MANGKQHAIHRIHPIYPNYWIYFYCMFDIDIQSLSNMNVWATEAHCSFRVILTIWKQHRITLASSIPFESIPPDIYNNNNVINFNWIHMKRDREWDREPETERMWATFERGRKKTIAIDIELLIYFIFWKIKKKKSEKKLNENKTPKYVNHPNVVELLDGNSPVCDAVEHHTAILKVLQ